MTTRTPRRGLVRTAVGCVVGASSLALMAVPAHAVSGVTANRLGGSDRYATSAAIATSTFSSVPTVVVTSGDNFPDALAASYLAGRLHAPILTTNSDQLSTSTASALQTLGAKSVDLVGGTYAVAPAVQATLQSDGYSVERIAGPTRYDTAADIAELFPASFVGSLTGTSGSGATAIVATGAEFPDGLSAGPLSYEGSFPLLLTEPDSLASQAASALQSLDIKQVLLIGGTLAVSQAVQDSITAMGITVTRVAGQDRTDTAQQVATLAIADLGFKATTVGLARGDVFADALAAAGRCGFQKEPLVLTESPNSLGSYTTSFLTNNASTTASIDVFGEELAISDATVSAAQTAAT